jgi:hypothetical protein
MRGFACKCARARNFGCIHDYLYAEIETASMNRYFFNFRKGDEISPDRIGMYLPDLDAARDEAVRTCLDLIDVAEHTGEGLRECELQVADASGEPVLRIPLRDGCGTRH